MVPNNYKYKSIASALEFVWVKAAISHIIFTVSAFSIYWVC